MAKMYINFVDYLEDCKDKQFNNPTIFYSTACTCTFSFTLPTQYYNDYNQFKLQVCFVLDKDGGLD